MKFDGEICGGVLVENASDDFPQQNKLENLLANFAGTSPPIPAKTSPTSLWKSLVLTFWKTDEEVIFCKFSGVGSGGRPSSRLESLRNCFYRPFNASKIGPLKPYCKTSFPPSQFKP